MLSHDLLVARQINNAAVYRVGGVLEGEGTVAHALAGAHFKAE